MSRIEIREVVHSHKDMLNEDGNSVKKNEESIFGIFMEVYQRTCTSNIFELYLEKIT